MSVTVNLSPEIEQRLRERAAQKGQSFEMLIQDIVEHAASFPNGSKNGTLPSDVALTPFRREVKESGISDEELLGFFEELRDENYREKHGQSGGPRKIHRKRDRP